VWEKVRGVFLMPSNGKNATNFFAYLILCIFDCTEWYDDSVALLIGVAHQLSDQPYIRSVHQKKNCDNEDVPKNLQYNWSLGASNRADRVGLCGAGPAGIGCGYSRHRCVVQHRCFLRP